VAVTNFYKYSLNQGQKDIHPEGGLAWNLKGEYYQATRELVELELRHLKPAFILTFKGDMCELLGEIQDQLGFGLQRINDPSWILQGGGGVFKPGGSWHERAENMQSGPVRDLVKEYVQHIRSFHKKNNRYHGKLDSVEIYLLCYALELGIE